MIERSLARPAYFKFCPSCGASDPAFLDGKRWLCGACGFEYFHNVATAAGLVVERQGEILLVERAKEPRKGKLGLPGGFVEPGERAEEAVLRECREEIGWAPPSLAFLGSFPNSYEYGGVAYSTCDLFFYYHFRRGEGLPAFSASDGEAESIRMQKLASIDGDGLAFPSVARALAEYGKMRALPYSAVRAHLV